jgi:hypothetical protein
MRGYRMERRAKERRANIINPVFPLLTVFGRIMDDRRKQPDRRLNNIQVKFLRGSTMEIPEL